MQVENHACVSNQNWFFSAYRIIVIGVFLSGTHFLLLLVASATFIFQLYKHHKSKVSQRQGSSDIPMKHLNVQPSRMTPDNHVEGSTLDGNDERSRDLDSTTSITATENPVYDRVFFLDFQQNRFFLEYQLETSGGKRKP